MKVLIVEDQAPVSDMLRRYVEPIAREVVVASTMDEALHAIETRPPFDLITLDLNLPDSTTLESVARIKEIHDKNDGGFVVVITGMLGVEARKQVEEAGADGFFQKIETVETRENFFSNLKNMVNSAIRNPVRYQRNLAVAEKLIDKLKAVNAAVEAKKSQKLEP